MSSLQCWNAPLARARQIGLPLVLLLGALGSANELACAWATTRPQLTDSFTRLASDAQLRALHAMLLPATPERRKGEYDVDVLLGLAKLDDTDSLEEASALLSDREKLAVLGNRAGFERFCQLAMACHAQEQ